MASIQSQKQREIKRKEKLPDVIEQLEASLKAALEGRIRKSN